MKFSNYYGIHEDSLLQESIIMNIISLNISFSLTTHYHTVVARWRRYCSAPITDSFPIFRN